MDERVLTEEELERLLRSAEEAHADYERELGHPDADWPTWYAHWIFQQLPQPGSAG